MSAETTQNPHRIFTIPNLLSFFRICLIPVIVWLYVFRGDSLATTLVLLLSGLTDVVDGIIARRFGMVSDLGKILDPVADKLTQGVVLICLLVRFPHIGLLLALFIVKEAFAAVTGLWGIRRARVVKGAEWHGKLTTVAIYTMILVHLIWADIPPAVSTILVGVCMGIMLMSLVLYAIRNIKMIRGKS